MAIGTAAGTSAADLQRRAALARSSGRLGPQALLDWGEGLLAMGHAGEARLLFKAAFLQQGFSCQLAAVRRPLLARAGLADDIAARADARRPDGNTVELAIAELRGVARTFAGTIARGVAERPPRQRSVAGLHPTAVQRRGATVPSERPVAGLIDDLFGWLSGAAADGPTLESALAAIESLRAAEGDPAGFDAAALAGADPAVLAPALAFQAVRAFLRDTGDLLLPPFGSPALFHAAAQLDGAGLGPYFGNVARIVRRSADVFELAGIAQDAAPMPEAFGAQAWIALLGRGFTGGLLDELIDDLGDENAAFALHAMLDRMLAAAAADIDQPRVMRIRDAAIDNLDYELAGRAQRAVVRLRPGNMLELRILGIIDASGGHVAAAEQTFVTCLQHDPQDRELQLMIEANRLRRFAPFARTRGYGSPPGRQLKRIRLRSNRDAERSWSLLQA